MLPPPPKLPTLLQALPPKRKTGHLMLHRKHLKVYPASHLQLALHLVEQRKALAMPLDESVDEQEDSFLLSNVSVNFVLVI